MVAHGVQRVFEVENKQSSLKGNRTQLAEKATVRNGRGREYSLSKVDNGTKKLLS